MKRSAATSRKTTWICDYLQPMNRIMIGCLVLLFAGCCKNDPQDCRLVGTWITAPGVEDPPVVIRFEESGETSVGWEWNGAAISDPTNSVLYSTWSTADGMLTIANSDEPIPYLIYSDGDSLEMLDAKLGRIL